MSFNRTCILIYGMHRSGTSALSGALDAIDVYFGKSISPPSFDNPKGFFENYKIQEFNDLLLAHLGRHWHDTKPLNMGFIDQLAQYQEKAKEIIRKEFSNTNLFAIKDPRISLLLPFWEKVMDELQISIRHVIMLRAPSEIESSLKKRNSFHPRKSELLIGMHLLYAERNSRDKKRVFIDFNELCASPNNCIEALIKKLQLQALDIKLNPALINASISTDLRNYKSLDHKNRTKTNDHYFEEIPLLLRKSEDDESIKRLDFIFSDYLQIKEAYHEEVDLMTIKSAKLFIDYGEGYKESESIQIPIEQEVEHFQFSFKEGVVEEIMFVPVLTPCKIQIKKILLGDGDIKYELSENSDSYENDILTFNQNHPRIILKLDAPQSLSQVLITIKYIIIGSPATKSNKPFEHRNRKPVQNERLWLKALQTSLSNPLRLLKNINYQNFRTLKSALRRESPRQIIRNFKKLLERKDRQKVISNTATNSRVETISLEESDSRKASIEKEEKNESFSRILYVTPQLPEYDTSSGGRRAITYLSLLQESHEVHIFCLGRKKPKYQEYLENKGFSIVKTGHSRYISQELSYVHVILYSWYYTYHEAKALTKIYSEAISIIDSVDVQWVREARSVGILDDIDVKRVLKNKKSEIVAYSSVDKVWAVSDPDKKAIIAELPNCSIDIVSNIHLPIKTDYKDPNTNNILFIGGYNHYPNLSAVELLALDIFPDVLKEVPTAQLLIAGSSAPEQVIHLGQLENVEFLGFVPEEDLEALYDTVLLSASPLLTGAGIKGKVTEAMAHMVPVVTNNIGNEGINLEHGRSGLVVEHNELMAAQITKALNREYNLGAMAKKAQERLSELADPKSTNEVIERSICRPVDICIVTWNKLSLLKKCIESILTLTKYPHYNIIVHSNGCTDGSQEYLSELESKENNVTCILSSSNDVFVKPNNSMMKLNHGHDKILLNNDVVVTEGWLNALYYSAYISPKVAIVGSKLLYPDGRLQEFGSELYDDGSGRNIGKWDEDPYHQSYSHIQAVGYVSGCSMYIKSRTISLLKGFNEDYHPCYYEDSDLCYRAWKNDMITLVTPHSIVYHFEGGTSGVDESKGFKSYQQINKSKFVADHKAEMRKNKDKVKKANQWLVKLRK